MSLHATTIIDLHALQAMSLALEQIARRMVRGADAVERMLAVPINTAQERDDK